MKEDFKNTIKQTAENHSDDINPDMIWSGIESKLEKKNKKRFAGFWIFGGMSLVTALLIYSFFWSSDYSVNQSSNLVSPINKEVNNILSSNKSITNKVNEKENPQSQIIVEQKNVEINEVVTENNNSISEKNESLSKSSNSKIINAVPKDSNTRLKTFKSKSDDNDLNKSYLPIEKNLNTKTKNIESKVTKSQGINDIEANRKGTVGNGIKSVVIKKEFLLIENVINKNRPSLTISKAKLLKPNSLDINNRFFEIDIIEKQNSNPSFTSTERDFSLLSGVELYSGIYFGTKTVSDLDQVYAEARNESEELLEQWSLGLRLDVVKVFDFTLQSGVRYSMITDRMQILNPYQDLTEYTYDQSRLIGDEIMFINTVEVSDPSASKIIYTTEQYNSQKIISIPLNLSFGKTLGKLDLGLGFGVDINYHLADTHVILNQDGKAAVNKVGGKWVNPSLSGGLIAGYHLNDIWAITSTINYRGITLSDHESISTLRSNYKLFGIELGVKKSL